MILGQFYKQNLSQAQILDAQKDAQEGGKKWKCFFTNKISAKHKFQMRKKTRKEEEKSEK